MAVEFLEETTAPAKTGGVEWLDAPAIAPSVEPDMPTSEAGPAAAPVSQGVDFLDEMPTSDVGAAPAPAEPPADYQQQIQGLQKQYDTGLRPAQERLKQAESLYRVPSDAEYFSIPIPPKLQEARDNLEEEQRLLRLRSDQVGALANGHAPIFDEQGKLYEFPVSPEERGAAQQQSAEKAKTESEAQRQERIKILGHEPGFLESADATITSGVEGTLSELMRAFQNSNLYSPEATQYVANLAHDQNVVAGLGHNTPAAAGRALGGFLNIVAGNPAGKAGVALATLRGALQTRAQVYDATGSADAADKAALKTIPELGLYLLGGKVAAKAVGGMLPEGTSALKTGLAEFGGATVMNMGVSNIIAKLEDREYDLGNMLADTLFGAMHGMSGYAGKVSEAAKERAHDELLARGFTDAQLMNARQKANEALNLHEQAQADNRAMVEQVGANLRGEAPTAQDWADVKPNETPAFELKPAAEKPADSAADIVPAIKVGGEVIPGQQGDTHLDVLNRHIEANPDQAGDALSGFDTKDNPNLFVGPDGQPISREELQQRFGKSDSQGLRELQNAPEASAPATEPAPPAAIEPPKPIPEPVAPPAEPVAPPLEPTPPPAPEPPKQRGFTHNPQVDAFGTEQTPLAFAIIDKGGLISRKMAERKGIDKGGQWDDQQPLARPVHERVYSESGQTPADMAQALYEDNLISEPSTTVMWRKLAEESQSAKSTWLSEKAQRTEEASTRAESAKQDKDFAKDSRTPTEGKEPIPVAELGPGDKAKVGDETLTVTHVDPDTHDVTLEDGKKYGVQQVEDGKVVYGEVVEKKAENTSPGYDWLPDEAQMQQPEPPSRPPPDQPADTGNAPGVPEGATSIKNAQVDAERARRGLPQAIEPLKRTFKEVWDRAMAAIDADPRIQDKLIAELKAKPRALTDLEDALILHRQVELQNSYDKTAAAVNEAHDRGDLEAQATAESRLKTEGDALFELYEVGKKSGTETSRGLNARKMLANSDYTLAQMVSRKRAAKGGEHLSDKEQKEVETQAADIEQTQKDLDARIDALETEASGQGVDAVIEEAKQELPLDDNARSLADRIIAKLDKAARNAEKELQALRSQFGSAPDVSKGAAILKHFTIMAAADIAKGVLTFARWVNNVRKRFVGMKTFDENFLPHLQPAWDKAREEGGTLDEFISDTPMKDRPAVRKVVNKTVDPEARRGKLEARMKDKAAEGAGVEMMKSQIRALAKSFVESGIDKRDPLVDAVHEVVKGALPTATRREVMDAISGYGDYKPLTKGKVEETLRDIRGQLQEVAKQLDIVAKRPLKKTGVEQRVRTAEERAETKKTNEMKRKFGVVVTDPASQLKSSLDAIHTLLRNEVEDLLRQFETGEATAKKTPMERDAEAERLAGLRDSIKGVLASLENKPGMTDAERVEISKRGLERSIADYERRIREGETATEPGKPPVKTPELDALRAKRDSLRAHLDELRAADASLAEETAFDAAMKAADDIEARLKAGDLGPKNAKLHTADTELLASAKERLATVRKNLKAAREASPEFAQAKLDAAKRAAEKSIAALDKRIQDGDFAAKSKPGITSPELETLRAERDAMRKLFDELKRATLPKLSPAEVALRALKARLATRNAEMVDRMARGDFAPKTRTPVDISKDPEAVRLTAENARIKRDYEQARIRDIYDRQSAWKKTLRYAAETLNLPRAVLSSWDLSAVLRQGGIITYGNPKRAAVAVREMFKALVSERAAERIDQEIRLRPGNALAERSGLYLAPLDDVRLSSQEEAIMSELANKIPGIRASNRAYVTFLNKLRADSFDTMVQAMQKSGVPLTQAEAQAIANYVNVATGRGNLGKMQMAGTALATVFFSPRLVASRFQYITNLVKLALPGAYPSMRVRKVFAKEYAKTLIGAGVVISLGLLAGGKIEKDPRSSDFGKLVFGNTRLDFMAGLAQVTSLLSRLGSGETKTPSGKMVPLRGDKVPFGSGNSADVLFRFMRTKLSPVVGTSVDLLAGRNVVGEKVTPLKALGSVTIPLTFRDIKDVMVEQGVAAGTALEILNLFGMGLQHYGQREK